MKKRRTLIAILIILVIILFTMNLTYIKVNRNPSRYSCENVLIYTIGDSITHGEIEYTEKFDENIGWFENITDSYQYWLNYSYGIKAINLGINGQKCNDIYERFDENISNGSTVILMCGINDLFFGGNSTTEVEDDLINIYELAKSKKNDLYITEILPYGCDAHCDEILEINKFLDESGWKIIPLYKYFTNGIECCGNTSYFISNPNNNTDVHPNNYGNKLISEKIYKQIYLSLCKRS